MVVLSAIGRFFKKIWDWIKQTAWIQPLLIVGIIFGVIFSIPSIVKAVNASKKEKSTYNTYYHQFKLSLENEKDSDADKFLYKLEDAMKPSADPSDFTNEYGDKFFVAFVEKSCDKCEDAKDGFATFEKKLNQNDAYKSEVPGESFKLYTIFADDENKETEDNKPAFHFFLERHQSFFESAGSVAYETPYYYNGHLSDSDLEALETADPEDFLAPTIFLVELGDAASNNQQIPGITEIMFGVDGSDKNAKARTLLDCWNHKGEFSYEKK